MRDRALTWEGCLNVRDLGGHVTDAGGTTRFGAVVRADSVRRLTDDGWRALVDYGVRRIVDLRVRSEIDADPPRDVPVEVVNIRLVPELDDPVWVEIDEIGRSSSDHASAQAAVYLTFLERFRPSFARAVAAIADAPEGTVLVHCEGGKDRTGLVAALLLRLAGVPLEEIGGDYALSGENLRDVLVEWIAEASDEDERARRRRISATHAETMVAVLEELERRHGSVRGYLLDAGAGERDVERVRTRLVG